MGRHFIAAIFSEFSPTAPNGNRSLRRCGRNAHRALFLSFRCQTGCTAPDPLSLSTLSIVRRERLLLPTRQCFQHAMQSAHDIALIAHMVARQDLTGQGIEPVCQSRQQLFCTLNVHRLPPLYGIAARSRPQQALVKGEQRFVDRKNIVVSLSDKILNNDVEFAAGTEGIAARASRSFVSARSSSSAMAKASAVGFEGL